FDDLITLTVRAADCDERHGPFLPKRDYEDEAQCDSNRSPSPLLKHYPRLEVTTMLLETIFAPFVKERPICVMARAVLERLLDAPRLDALFARTAQQQYTRELLFSSLVQLMSEVVLGVHPTVHAAYQANKETIGVSTTALYNKLDRVEPGVAAALVRDSAELAEP